MTALCTPMLHVSSSDLLVREELRQILWNAPEENDVPARRRTSREKSSEAAFLHFFSRSKRVFKRVVEARARVLREAENLVHAGIAPSIVDLSDPKFTSRRDIRGSNIAYTVAVRQLTDPELCQEVENLRKQALEYSSLLIEHPNQLIREAKAKIYLDCRRFLRWVEGWHLPHEDIKPEYAADVMSDQRKAYILEGIRAYNESLQRFIGWYM